MIKKLSLLILVIIFLGGIFFWPTKNLPPEKSGSSSDLINTPLQPLEDNSKSSISNTNPPVEKNIELQSPIDRAKERVSKKYFGIFVDPKTSPIQPERFSGYHTGVDFEIFPEELDLLITVNAICEGEIIMKKSATGYGGVIVQLCNLNNQPATIIYGHLNLTTIPKNIGANLGVGETIGQLGKNYSSETSGERKHLHLGIHRGSAPNILGYVQTKNELSNWIDPCLYVCE